MALRTISWDELDKIIKQRESKLAPMSQSTTQATSTQVSEKAPNSVSYKDISSDYEATREPSFIEKLATNFVSTAKDLNKEWSWIGEETAWMTGAEKTLKWASLWLRTATMPIASAMGTVAEADPTGVMSAVWQWLNTVGNYASTGLIKAYNPTLGRLTGQVSEDRAQDLTDVLSTTLGAKTWLKWTKFAESPILSKASELATPIKEWVSNLATKAVGKAEQVAPAYTAVAKNLATNVWGKVGWFADAVKDSKITSFAKKWTSLWLEAAYNPIGWTISGIGKALKESGVNPEYLDVTKLEQATGKKFEPDEAAWIQEALSKVISENKVEDLIPKEWQHNIKNYAPMIDKIRWSIEWARANYGNAFKEVFESNGIKNIADLRRYLLNEADMATWVDNELLKKVINEKVKPNRVVEAGKEASNEINSDTMKELYSQLKDDRLKSNRWNDGTTFFKNAVSKIDEAKWSQAVQWLLDTYNLINLEDVVKSAVKWWEKKLSVLTPAIFAAINAVSGGSPVLLGLNAWLALNSMVGRKWTILQQSIKDTAKWLKKSPVEEVVKETPKERPWFTEQTFEKTKPIPYKVEKTKKSTEKNTEKPTGENLTYTQKKKWLAEKPEKQKSKAQLDREFIEYQNKKIAEEAEAKKTQKVNRAKATKWLKDLEKRANETIEKAWLAWKEQVAGKEKVIKDQMAESLKKIREEAEAASAQAKTKASKDKLNRIKKGLADAAKWLGRLTWTMWPAGLQQSERDKY